MTKMPKEKKWAIPQFVFKILAVFIFLGGALTTAYPLYCDVLNDALANKVNDEYHSKENEKFRKEQNKKLRSQHQRQEALKDPFSNVSLQNAKDLASNPKTEFLVKHTIGFIYIPKIDQKLPIFDTINDTFMDCGATWFSKSNFPGSGKGGHTVITAHRGLPTATLFTDLDKLKNGDKFIVEVDEKYLAYEVYARHVVLPDDLSKLDPIDEQDTVTLLTCTPYMINSHRLLVVGKRISFTPSMYEDMRSIKSAQKKKIAKLVIGLSAAGVLAVFLSYFSYLRLKHARSLYNLNFRVLGEGGQPAVGTCYQLFDRRGKKPKRKNGKLIISEINPADGTVSFQKIPGVSLKIKQISDNNQYQKMPDMRIGILKRKAKEFTLKIKKRKLKGKLEKNDKDYTIYLQKKG
ncbi:MAG: class C sortase [Streptococcaceae bacterium]|jgi:sortase A|nr:class C sortase [Streptococcaceae bacterium]